MSKEKPSIEEKVPETAGRQDIRDLLESAEIDPEAIDGFKQDLEDAGEFVKECEANTPLQNLPYFEELAGNQEIMVSVLLEKFGVNPDTDKPAREYTMTGTGDVGEIKVKVFATNDPEVFIGQYTDKNGDVDWTIRPLEGEE